MLAWAVASHYEAAPDEAEVTVVPTYLVGGGAYAFTRNPMYVGGAAMQAGWAVLLGSVPVLAVGLGYVTALRRWGVPFEERLLRDRFGSSYDLYRQQVPRWLMRGRRSA
jgi:protein-S-isoprenylcysteine O-methyltransferase Ste14